MITMKIVLIPPKTNNKYTYHEQPIAGHTQHPTPPYYPALIAGHQQATLIDLQAHPHQKIPKNAKITLMQSEFSEPFLEKKVHEKTFSKSFDETFFKSLLPFEGCLVANVFFVG